MKKIIFYILAILFLPLAPFAFASGQTVSVSPNPVTNFSTAQINFTTGAPDLVANIYLYSAAGGAALNDLSTCGGDQDLSNGSANLSGFCGLTLGSFPNGDYVVVNMSLNYAGSRNTDCVTSLASCEAAYLGAGYIVENTFSIDIAGNAPAAPSFGGMIIVPTSTASALTASIGSQIADSGTLALIALAAGVPLAFYVMARLIELIPRKKNK
jgi:hypothetical protein